MRAEYRGTALISTPACGHSLSFAHLARSQAPATTVRERGAQIRCERKQGSERNNQDTDPDPRDQWVEKNLDDRQAALGILAGVDHIQVPRQRRVVGDNR